ncbi:hypothetical protein ACFFGV_08085 [Pontibacillus salicampi]|uniref:Uncharacterized protein n=1 Tax=Pontibacillus salicampi TaxID=1449801 RepID=A0ABV6LMQ0_9BACI
MAQITIVICDSVVPIVEIAIGGTTALPLVSSCKQVAIEVDCDLST